MKFEHAALNVPDPRAMAQWYVKHCGMQVVISRQEPPYMHFLADATGRTIFELYCNPAGAVPDYANQHPLTLHIAWAVEDAAAERDRLIAAGATLVSDTGLEDDTQLVMLKDPWGVALQLCQRAEPMP